MDGCRFITTGLFLLLLTFHSSALTLAEEQSLQLPPIGSAQLRLLTPTDLEVTLVTTKKADSPQVETWDFVDARGQCRLPGIKDLTVEAGDKSIPVKAIGFKRRVLYAPLKQRDLRIGNYLYVQLAQPVIENQTVKVKAFGNQQLRVPLLEVSTKADPLRWSPALHVNQTGYLPRYAKKAMVGYYLGSLGELNPAQALLPHSTKDARLPFQILEEQSGKPVFAGALTPRPDRGFPFESYQHVLEADFTGLKIPGQYRLFVPGLGTSFAFFIDEAVAGAFARTYALGLYHQRCGTDNALPFTRFTHGPCHTAPAEVPDVTRKFESANASLAKESANFKDSTRHSAPQLKSMAASLYPFVNRGPVDVRGGHHDAGDYSKYTINSASFIHQLVLAADVFAGVADLDNLGLPESGDGKSDVLQEAKWEADFLAKMQDADGGFYFLVYPREREYENDVPPDKGDPQIVFPKTTSVTAAAVAALAQCAASPVFKKQFPEAAQLYLEKARKGWAFLEAAIAKHGKDGAYQKITHYGDENLHDDELAWAACELFLATGEAPYHQRLQQWLHPADPNTRKWGWWRLYDAYGCAIRSYALAAKAGRLKREQLNPLLLEQCENEIVATGEDQLRRAQNSAYGTSFPEETKRARTAGWYFSSDAAFDLAVACQLDYPAKRDPRPKMIEAILSNLSYEAGCNPANISYLTGLGWKRQRDIVDQYAQNDRRILPPSGIPVGNIHGGFGWLYMYKEELDALSFPPDGAPDAPYPFYDRWGDAFNLSQEFVILNQARALGYLAWLMAQTPLKAQPWRAADGRITGLPAPGSAPTKLTLGLTAPGLDLSTARIVWESPGQEPRFGQNFTFTPAKEGLSWVEAEAQLPDGRRVFGVSDAPGSRLKAQKQ